MLEFDPILQHIKRIARVSDPEPAHCFQVARLVGMLFDVTRETHLLDNDALRLLFAAALLHDTGYGINPGSHHKGSRDVILAAELPGVAERDRATIACVARYHRGGHPKPHHKVYRDLAAAEQLRVRQLAGILRIADGLDRDHAAATRAIHAERAGSTLTITVDQREPSPTDLWGANRKKRLFEEVFGVDVVIEPHITYPP